MTHSWHILGLAIVLVLCVWLLDRIAGRRRSVHFRKLAREFHMRYSPVDRFNLAARIPAILPDFSAADMRVRDLMYRTHDGHHEYVFTAEYALGTISGTQRSKMVAGIREKRGDGGTASVTWHRSADDLDITRRYTDVLQEIIRINAS